MKTKKETEYTKHGPQIPLRHKAVDCQTRASQKTSKHVKVRKFFCKKTIQRMGNDGGSIPTRRELVTVKKKPLINDQTEQIRTKWLCCALKKEMFGPSISADLLGNLFDKANILKALVDKTLPPRFSHITSMKELVDVKFTKNQGDLSKDHQMGVSGENFVSPFMCPITQRPVNGKYTFSVLKTCGHAFSDTGLGKASGASLTCYNCGAVYTKDDILPLNPAPEVLVRLQTKLDEVKKANHELKMIKKEERKKKRESTDIGPSEVKRQRKAEGPKIRKSEGPLITAGLVKPTAVASQVHDKKKKTSETYQSIFAPPCAEGKYVVNATGLYRR